MEIPEAQRRYLGKTFLMRLMTNPAVFLILIFRNFCFDSVRKVGGIVRKIT